MNKTLIVGPSWVGDTVMAQCLLMLLKQRDPAGCLDVLAPRWTFALLERMPEISTAIEMPLGHGELGLGKRYRIAKSLRLTQYDQAIVLPNSFKSAFIPWMAGIPQRTGWVGEYRYGLLNDVRRLDKARYPLLIEQYMALGVPPQSALPMTYPSPRLQVTQTSQQAALDTHQVPWRGKPVLALCVGAAFGSAKCWPATYYAEVAKQKIVDGWDVWLFGSEKDRAMTAEVMRLTNDACENLAGRLALFETIDLLSLTSGVITNDSGLLHVAAALKKPIVALYGPTSPAVTPPLSDEAVVLKTTLSCQPCFQRTCPLQHHRCMRELLPAQVLSKIATWSTS